MLEIGLWLAWFAAFELSLGIAVGRALAGRSP
jgi:hypothetical protein